MENHSVVVTGGAQGIGKGIATALALAGMHVVLLDTDETAARETADALAALGVHSRFICGRSGDEHKVAQAVAEAETLGKGLYAAVANAGVARFKPLAELSLQEWNEVLTINLTGAFLLARTAAPALRQHHGALILIGSTRALMSEANTEAYSATKGGILALSHALAVSLGPEVRVNCVSPGWIATDAWQRSDRAEAPKLSEQDHAQHPAGRVGKPEDVAEMVKFLISPKAGFITGQNFFVDGGMTRKMIYV